MGVEGPKASEFTALVGSGAKARVGENIVYVGKPELFAEMDLNPEGIPDIERLTNEGETVILVGTDESITGRPSAS